MNMGKGNRKCICCGKEYKFCTHCADYDNLPRWMTLWHSENCKKLYDISSDYYDKKITAEEAKQEFSKCDLSYKNKLHKSVINAINEVNKIEKKKFKKEKNVTEEIKVEVEDINEINNEKFSLNK